jgi:cupin superfamily acireductone dioxygenase involved in methionine salvage
VEERFFITQDLDFSDLRLFEHVEGWSRYFVVATSSKIRVRVPHLPNQS